MVLLRRLRLDSSTRPERPAAGAAREIRRDFPERRRYLQAINYARVVAILCGSLGVFFLWRVGGTLSTKAAVGFFVAAAAALALSVPYDRLTRARRLTLPAYLMLTIDTAIVGFGSWIIGQSAIGIPVFFTLPIVASALVVGAIGSLLLALLAGLLYAGLLLIEGTWLARPGESLGAFILHLGAFLTLALVSTLLSRELHHALDRARRLRREAEIIHHINRLTDRNPSIQRLFRAAIRLIRPTGGLSTCAIWTLNSEGTLVQGVGDPLEWPVRPDPQRVVEFIGSPERPAGVLVASFRGEPSIADREFLRRVAGQLAVSLERVQLQGATQAAESLLAATYAPSASLSLRTVAETIAEQGARLSMADEVFLAIRGDPPIEVSCGGPYWTGQPGAVARLVQTLPGLLDQLLLSPRPFDPEILERLGHRDAAGVIGSALSVTFDSYGEELGFLIAVRAPDRTPFDSATRAALQVFGERCAQAIQNARLYEHLAAQMEEGRRTQAQLVQSAKLAAIGELAANVAHEINNPLTGILMNASIALEAVEEGPATPDLPELRVIREEAMRARDIVRNLLDFSRQTSPRLEPVDLVGNLRQTLALVDLFLEKSLVRLHTDFAAALPPVRADANQLKQVFLNLINNAVHAMPNGGDLFLSICREGDTIVTSVRDTGIGIPPDHLPRVFEPFFSTKDAVKGTGLGLSVSHGIVSQHQGTIEVTSQVGVGTTFRVVLPVDQSFREGQPCQTHSAS